MLFVCFRCVLLVDVGFEETAFLFVAWLGFFLFVILLFFLVCGCWQVFWGVWVVLFLGACVRIFVFVCFGTVGSSVFVVAFIVYYGFCILYRC